LHPRRSPDGRLLAFQAMVDGTTQVGVMDPESGDWNVLTSRRDLGIVEYSGAARGRDDAGQSQAAHAADARYAKCKHGFAMADFEQHACEVQRSRAAG
jgi:hypothetical protein